MSLVLTTDSEISERKRTWTNGKHAHQDTEFTTFLSVTRTTQWVLLPRN
jgi:hypothetical protein